MRYTAENILVKPGDFPDDPDLSAYRYIIVSAKRARQLQDGARPFLPSSSRKPTVTAMEEVRRGLVKYNDPTREQAQDEAALAEEI